ncbi:MAG: hypothetical protein Kow0042_29790 [Calditrichia bacterium]
MEIFPGILARLFASPPVRSPFILFDPLSQFDINPGGEEETLAALNSAFLILLCEGEHPAHEQAASFLNRLSWEQKWASIVDFYREGLAFIPGEIWDIMRIDGEFAACLVSLGESLNNPENSADRTVWNEKIWSVFLPEAAGIRGNEEERIARLRERRRVQIVEKNPTPINNPGREMIFTANVLLTLPPEPQSVSKLPLSEPVKNALKAIFLEPQRYWYDHPIPVGVAPANNEVLYGLSGLDGAIDFEKKRGSMHGMQKVTCLLSLSVTHQGLQKIAKQYLEETLNSAGSFQHLKVFLFTENDTRRICREVLIPALQRFLGRDIEADEFDILGVDGEYGRHYSFLKAIVAFWQVFIAPEIRATFKIDLDQVFPQKDLVRETGDSAFEHFRTPLWGARGIDSRGKEVELGMIAGALVNRDDIQKSIFTPDVTFPEESLGADEHIFFSRLPQALSTIAEMMTRYNSPDLNGKSRCIQRIHVTGGTTGILIESLRRHRPFTPSFIGRAEDQAYILSVINGTPPRLGYLHQPGLIMRHDKEAFAGEAIRSAYIGKLIGDYQRILNFSAYARALSGDFHSIKNELDPFTGCFISRIPLTVVYLRFALKAADFFRKGQSQHGVEFIRIGAERLLQTLKFVRGVPSPLQRQLEKERTGWDLYYDLLQKCERALHINDSFAKALRRKARKIIADCRLRIKD